IGVFQEPTCGLSLFVVNAEGLPGDCYMSRFPRFVIRGVTFRHWRFISTIVLLLVFASVSTAAAQAGFDDDRVMLQGFYWESYRHGYPEKFPNYGDKH